MKKKSSKKPKFGVLAIMVETPVTKAYKKAIKSERKKKQS
jgi:hypothetical protein